MRFSASDGLNISVKEPAGTSRLPSLDGLRAVSIAFVLIGHLSGTRGFVRVDPGVGDYAHLGVTIFFVISGFLITRLMLSEYSRNGYVSLRIFYARRVLRLFPASYAFITCISLLWLAGVVHFQARDFWHAVTYTMNYLPDRSWQFGHLWSLSVEEQFYFIWPCTFVLLGPRRAGWAVVAGILFGPVARSCAWLLLRGTPYYNLELFPTVADALGTGCLLAIGRDWLERKNWYLRLFQPACSAALVALILLINRYEGYTVAAVFGTSIVNLSLAILIHRCIYLSGDWIGKILNLEPVAFAGVLSYSLYLWQQPFINRNSSAWINGFPQNLIFAIAAAFCSFWLVEKPILKLRRRLRSEQPTLMTVSSQSGR